MMRLQNVINTNDSLQITYIEESDIDSHSGIMEARTLDIPHATLDPRLMADLIDSIQQIIEEARVLRRRPEASFQSPR
jgi:hypothetical protein